MTAFAPRPEHGVTVDAKEGGEGGENMAVAVKGHELLVRAKGSEINN